MPISLLIVIPKGVSEPRVVFSGRVAPRDLLFGYGKGLIRLHDGQHFTPCSIYGRDNILLSARLATQEQSRRIFHYKIQMLSVGHFEQFTSVEAAIAREKEIKGWRREKKDKLVESMNPTWKDLAVDWYPKGLRKDGVPIDFNKIKHKVPQGYSPAGDCAGLAYALRDDDA